MKRLTVGTSPRCADVSLRIAFLGGRGVGGSYSGIETYYEEVGRRLASYGHEVFVYCRPYFTPSEFATSGIIPVLRPCLRTKHAESASHTFISTLDVLLRSADIVQFHALGPSLFSAIPRLRGARTIASIRGLDWRRPKWGPLARSFLRFCESMSYRLPNAVTVVSRTLQRYYREQYGVDVHYIPNGVTPSPPPPPREIHSLGLLGKDYLLFMGRLSPEKGCDVLIEAYRSVAARAKLVMAGGTSYTDTYIQRLKRAAPPGVIFPGQVGGRLRDELYAHAAAFVLPSTIEGLSVALLEAMGFGCCVISSDIAENAELVDGVGLMAPPGNVKALARLLTRVLDSPDQAAALGERARQRVAAQYTWDVVARQTEAFFYEVLEQRRSAARAEMSS